MKKRRDFSLSNGGRDHSPDRLLPWQHRPNRKTACPEAVFAGFLGKMPNFNGIFSGMILAM